MLPLHLSWKSIAIGFHIPSDLLSIDEIWSLKPRLFGDVITEGDRVKPADICNREVVRLIWSMFRLKAPILLRCSQDAVVPREDPPPRHRIMASHQGNNTPARVEMQNKASEV